MLRCDVHSDRRRLAYLATVLDLYSRRIVGWSHGTDHACTALVCDALSMAISVRQPARVYWFISDRAVNASEHRQCQKPWSGTQHEPQRQLGQYRDGTFFSEFENGACLADSVCQPAEAKQDITDCIVNFYKQYPVHSKLGCRSAAQCETLWPACRGAAPVHNPTI
ncbi:DDE-type integrase/transposase/recombinase [Klebsiella pneumoniae]|uniref:DDE-type integrase/transposase/recombinase n=1 Tax=Klebsiella pneumoniae TaxID=573 RepID=UPI003A5D05BE